MGVVTYISFTEEKLKNVLLDVAREAVKAYQEKEQKQHLFSVREIAGKMKVDPRTVRSRIDAGLLPLSERNPDRVSEYHLLKYLEGNGNKI